MDNNSDIEDKINSGLFQLVRKRNVKSAIWSTFAQILKDDQTILDGFVCCRICKQILKYNGRHSSNLNRHKCFHPTSSSTSMKKVSELDRQEAIEACATWLIEDCRAFASIKGTGFRKLVNFLLKIGARYGTNIDINDILPDPVTLSHRITATAQERKNELKLKIANVVHNEEASVTIDHWQDNYVKRNFLSATLHFEENFEMFDIVLGIKSMDLMGSSGENMHDKLQNLLSEFGVADLKSIIFVTDRHSSVNKALKNYTRLNSSSHLFSNVLDSAIESTDELTEVISACKKIVKYLKNSSLQRLLQQTSLKSHCPTRWCSHYAMFKSISDNWQIINETLVVSSDMDRLSDIDISLVRSLAELCSCFDVILGKLQGYNYPSICFIIPSINRLRVICEFKENDAQAVSALKSNILRELDETWVPNLSIWHKAAFFLFPPANNEQGNDLTEIQEFCINEIMHYEQKEPQQSSTTTLPTITSDFSSSLTIVSIAPPSPITMFSHCNNSIENAGNVQANSNASLNTELDFFFPTLFKRSTISMPESAKKEVSRYCLESILIDEDFDVLQWWRANAAKYPRLSKLALRILSVPASSVASEQVTSLAGNIITEKRNRLAPKMVDNILFLHSFYKNIENL